MGGKYGEDTATYKGYERTWDIAVLGKEVVHCSNDPVFGGDSSKMNPEDLLLSALSSCHMLWYLHLASNAKIKVLSYEDQPIGVGENMPDGTGRFLSATLNPKIEIEAGGDIHKHCFIARSVNFPVSCEPDISER